MLDKSKTYLIVGLGLLGGKYAQVLSQKGRRWTMPCSMATSAPVKMRILRIW